MKRYLLSPAADADLVDIWLYSAERWNAEQADRYTGQIVDMCADIAAGRARGKPVANLKHSYHKVAVGSHFIIYREAGETVAIIRIFHRRMDIPSRLQE